jgi:ADP-heptose:LPS heptosyltransferase
MNMKKSLKNIFRLMIDTLIYAESLFHKKNGPLIADNESRRRILIMRKDGLGDCIIFYPTLKAYREYYKNDEITLVFPTYFKDLAPLLLPNPVDKIIWFDHKKFGSSIKYRRQFLLDLKRGGYGTFIYPVFSRETIGFFMMKMTGAREKISFDGDISGHGRDSEKRGLLKYTRLIRPPESMKSEIIRDAFFAQTITGHKVPIIFPTIDIKRLNDTLASELAKKNNLYEKKYIVMFPGAGAHYRIWMKENFAAILDYFDSKGFKIVLCGSSKEHELVKGIIAEAKSGSRALDLAGQTDLATLSHILAKSFCYFGSDTGILHLAVAVGTPAIAIVGMGGLDRFFPYGDLRRNRAVYDKTHAYPTGNWTDAHLLAQHEIHPSIRNITVDDAKREIDSLLQYLSQ